MLSTQQSTDQNVLSNQIALNKAGIKNLLLLNNNLNHLIMDVYDNQCQGDAMCAATFDLCYSLEAVIVECDKSKRITDKIWQPKTE